MSNRRYLDGPEPDQDPTLSAADPWMGMQPSRSHLPPDPGYTGTPNESLANSRSKGNQAVADMSPDNGKGDINEGVSFRTRMANQAPEDSFEEDIYG